MKEYEDNDYIQFITLNSICLRFSFIKNLFKLFFKFLTCFLFLKLETSKIKQRPGNIITISLITSGFNFFSSVPSAVVDDNATNLRLSSLFGKIGLGFEIAFVSTP